MGGDPPPERAGDWAGQPHRKATRLHCKKGMYKIFPARESLLSDIPAGDGKTANSVYTQHFILVPKERNIVSVIKGTVARDGFFAHCILSRIE